MCSGFSLHCQNQCSLLPEGKCQCPAERQVPLGLPEVTTALFSAVGGNAGAGKEQKLQQQPCKKHKQIDSGRGMSTVGDVLSSHFRFQAFTGGFKTVQRESG